MKRICALLLAVCLFALMLAGCGKSDYPPVKSTEAEARTVLTISYGDRSYEIPYELYRTFFLTYRDEVDGGDRSVWSGEDSETYRETINRKIFRQMADIYAVRELCTQIGYDFYSKDADDKIREYIRVSVEGGTLDGMEIEGCGSYEAYLQRLKDDYVNYSVQDLIYRYYLGENALESFYFGTDSEYAETFRFGDITYTDADLRAFYEKEDTGRFLWICLDKDVHPTDAGVRAIHDKIVTAVAAAGNAEKDKKAGETLFRYTTTAYGEVMAGYLVTPYNLDENQYGDLIAAALALDVHEVSQPIRVHSDAYNGYFIVYRAEKTEEYLAEHRADVVTAFLQDSLGRKLAVIRDAMVAGAVPTEELKNLDLSAVTMEN